MRRLTTKEMDHIASIIGKEVSYINGRTVSVDTANSACWKAACKIEAYLIRKFARENENNRQPNATTLAAMREADEMLESETCRFATADEMFKSLEEAAK